VNRRRPLPSLARIAGRAARAVAVGVAAALLLAVPACRNGQPAGGAAGSASPATASVVVLHGAGGRSIPFQVELARTEAERNRGLMYRSSLAADAGMLFLFEKPSALTFWMKNTLIPLDMIFIGGDRRIVGIVENAEPQTLTSRRVDGLAQYVLEINGGFCARLGVTAGSEVDFRDVPPL
jgi:hypothetical protein